jgi:hypothetical protein
MSDSYTVLPITQEVRAWLMTEGYTSPRNDGRPVTFHELKLIVSSLQEIASDWNDASNFQDGYLKSALGMETTIIIGSTGGDSGPCEFHFRGGEPEFIESIVCAIALHAGPQAIYAHSGSFIKVIAGETQ